VATYRLTIAYDGTDFRGWAKQPGKRTVQDELEGVLSRLFGEPVGLIVAGRTDAGVHASAQVASFSAEKQPPDALMRALNGMTPSDISVRTAEQVEEDFNARWAARSRRYRYRVETASVPDPFERDRAFWFPYPLERTALEACAAAVVGSHDFTAFTPTDTRHTHFRREILHASWSQESETILAFEVEADAFLRSMVRALVGTMLEVGTGRRVINDFESLLDGAARAEAGDTAPARGLYLIAVRY